MSQEVGLPKCKISNVFLKGIESIRYFCIGSLHLALGVAFLELVARSKDLIDFDSTDEVKLAIKRFLKFDVGYVSENAVYVLTRFMLNEQRTSFYCFDLLRFYVEQESFYLSFIESGFKDIMTKILGQEFLPSYSLGEDRVEGFEKILSTMSSRLNLCIKFFDIDKKTLQKYSPSETGWYLKVYIIHYDSQFSIGYSQYMNLYDEKSDRNNQTIFKLFSKVKANDPKLLVNKVGTIDYAIYNKSLMKSMNFMIEYLSKKEIFNEGFMNELEKSKLQDENQNITQYLQQCREIKSSGKFINCSICGDFVGYGNFQSLGCNSNCVACMKCLEGGIEKCQVCNQFLNHEYKEPYGQRNEKGQRMNFK